MIISSICFQVQHLISELNEILAHDTVDEGGLWKKKLADQSLKLFEFLPRTIQEQLMLERDPHGNVQVLNGVMVLCLLYLFCPSLCNSTRPECWYILN
jgi:hypothetical protein